MSATVKASYSLHPPAGTANVAQRPTNSFNVDVEKSQDMRSYYANLRDAVMAAKSQLGQELTAWRDAVGTSENSKEAKIAKKQNNDDEDSEEVEEE